jgi:uncharacterized protein (DUF1501 family)
VNALTEHTLDRRRFLGLGAAGVGGAALSPLLSSLPAFAAPPVGATEGIVVVITLDGGNDGLNTVCPVGSPIYYEQRPTLAIPKPQALPLNRNLGLHPSLRNLKKHWDGGRLAIVQGVGYSSPDLSHFESMDIWMRGWGGAGKPHTGWLGRWVDRLPNAQTESLYAVAIDNSTPMHLKGTKSKVSGVPLHVGDAFGMDRSDRSDRRMFNAATWFGDDPSGLGTWGDAYGDALAQLMGLTVKIGPAYGHPAPQAHIGRQLALAAQLLNANLGIRVVDVHLGGFDTHADQAEWHAQLLAELDSGIRAFFTYLQPKWKDQVVVVTFSEFGRRLEENGDGGTDHGTASVCFVLGNNVRGGLYGAYPPLRSLDPWGNLKANVDFRQVYSTIVEQWLHSNPAVVLGRRYTPLNFFRARPGR